MRFAKVQFGSSDDQAHAIGYLMRQAKTVVLADGSFIVPEPALALLNEKKVSFNVIQWLNQDDVHQALRNPLAHAV